MAKSRFNHGFLCICSNAVIAFNTYDLMHEIMGYKPFIQYPPSLTKAPRRGYRQSIMAENMLLKQSLLANSRARQRCLSLKFIRRLIARNFRQP